MSTPGNTPQNDCREVPREIEDQLALYFDNQATPEVVQTIQSWLQADPANARAFAEYGYIERMIFCAQKTEDASAIFGLLAEMENEAQADIVTLVDELPAAQAKPSAHDFAEAGRYLYEHATANKRILYTAGSAIAAVLLLAVTLFFAFSGGQDDPVVDPLANAPLWDTPTPTHHPVVATLTDSVGAQWRSDDKPVPMPMGAQLVAFERFTLTHGFAEITTRRGAKALLQAPCTIELTDSDNAIRLHQGQLVGKCETALSKGFTVHAPGMDVVDLGTEFGVAADAVKGSTVLVMQGSVRAQPTEQSPRAFEPVVLEENQARRVQPEVGSLSMIAVSEAPVFYEEVPHPYVMAVLNAAPVAYWRFEDDARNTIANEVSQGTNDLNIVGPAQLTDAGVIGKAGRLHNRRQPYAYFETTEPIEALNGLDEYTIELWYYTDERYEAARKNSVASVFNLYDPDQGNAHKNATEASLLSIELVNDFWIDKDKQDDSVLEKPPGWREFSIRGFPMRDLNSNERREIYTTQNYPIGRWQHLVLVKAKDGVTLYLDGQPVEQASYTPPTINPAAIRLGQSVLRVIQDFDPDSPYAEGLYRPLRGRLDEVALYDKALTAPQIAKHNALATGEGDSP